MLREMRMSAAFQALLYIEERMHMQNENLEGQGLDSSAYQKWKESFLKAQEEFAERKLISEELARWNIEEQHALALEMYKSLNDEQRLIDDAVIAMISNAQQKRGNCTSMMFIDAPGGTGKTYLLNTICASVRSAGYIVLATAASGIAAHLLPGGRTSHSKFKIPIPIKETCNISGADSDPLGNLLREAALLIFDEASMLHRSCFEAVDKTLRDITRKDDIPFGGIPVLLSGDFRQMMPVVRRGTKYDTMDASIRNSDLWEHMRVLRLTENMRISLRAKENPSQLNEFQAYGDFLERIGDGKEPPVLDRGEDVIKIPNNIVSLSPTQDFVQEIFPNLEKNFLDIEYLTERAIFNDVDKMNQCLLDMCPGIEEERLSLDSLKKECEHLEVTEETLHQWTEPGFPLHKLRLKVGAPVMLLRNLGGHEGACNGTKLIVKDIGRHVLLTTFASGEHKGELLALPRIPLTASDNLETPWTRKQFPVKLAFCMTIHKAQGQTLKKVGVFLPRPVFSHGQLYVALSRVGSPRDVSVYIENRENASNEVCDEGSFTKNIVFKFD